MDIDIESQFHYGSIKTKYQIYTGFKRTCLNSTMVRLKQGSLNNMKYEWFRLNSTMVRLKQQQQFTIEIKNKKSQFHYGSIKTYKMMLLIKLNRRVSIPLWFD